MIIKYLGHSSFYVVGKDKSVVTDPFGDIGYDIERVSADYVTVSHGHFDHSNVGGVNAKRVIVGSCDGFTSINCKHDEYGGSKRGENRIFLFTVDGVKFCHLGDIGEYRNSSLVEKIGNPDVLFVPVGGNYTIDAAGAVWYIEAIKPKIAVPMHFGTNRSRIDVAPIDDFIRRAEKSSYKFAIKKYTDTIEFDADSLPVRTEIVVLNVD